MRLLVIEDDPDLSRALVRALEKRGFDVTPVLLSQTASATSKAGEQHEGAGGNGMGFVFP